MAQWEYRVLKFSPSGTTFRGGKIPDEWLAGQLNNFGKDGWELVSTFTSAIGQGSTNEVAIILKRPASVTSLTPESTGSGHVLPRFAGAISSTGLPLVAVAAQLGHQVARR